MTSRPAFVLEDERRGELLEVVYLSPEELTPYEGNARKHDIKDVEQIKESIRLDGFNDPIGIWGENNIIVEGHGRQIAALEMGLDKVPCIRLDHLTDAQRRDYAIRHNRTAELSTWDWQTLESEITDLSTEGFDIAGLFPEFSVNDEEVETSDRSLKMRDKYQIIIEFEDEESLEEAYNALESEGYKCRISTL